MAGVDEAGRGPLAGPVVAAAVVLPSEWFRLEMPESIRDLNDSKKLCPDRRETLYDQLTQHSEIDWAVAVIDASEIDRLNILRATHLGMIQALAKLRVCPDHVLIDGLPVPNVPIAQTAIVGGDGLSWTIAAASVLAKVTRDRWMLEADQQWPGYGFARHKGYPTASHIEALRKLGPCPIHRRTFAPIREELEQGCFGFDLGGQIDR